MAEIKLNHLKQNFIQCFSTPFVNKNIGVITVDFIVIGKLLVK